MNVTTFPIFEIIALLGILIGPAIAYYAAKHKIGAEVLLINIDTIKGWSDARKTFEIEIMCLHKKLKDSRKACEMEMVDLRKKFDNSQKSYEVEIAELHEKLKNSRKAFQAEIAELHKQLIEERDRRRLERTRYLEQIASLEEELRAVLKLLKAAEIEDDRDE